MFVPSIAASGVLHCCWCNSLPEWGAVQLYVRPSPQPPAKAFCYFSLLAGPAVISAFRELYKRDRSLAEVTVACFPSSVPWNTFCHLTDAGISMSSLWISAFCLVSANWVSCLFLEEVLCPYFPCLGGLPHEAILQFLFCLSRTFHTNILSTCKSLVTGSKISAGSFLCNEIL